MSNTKLLTTAYVETHRAADRVSQIFNGAVQGEVLARQATPDISELKQNLTAALCAVTELENRAVGMQEPKRGD